MEAGKHVLCNDYYENYHKFKLRAGEVLFLVVVILDVPYENLGTKHGDALTSL